MKPFPEIGLINGDWELGVVDRSYFTVRNKVFSPLIHICVYYSLELQPLGMSQKFKNGFHMCKSALDKRKRKIK